MNRAKGHIRATRVPGGAHTYLVGSSAALPAEVMLDDAPDDQGVWQSCTGFGYYAGAAKCWIRSNGHPVEPAVSALAGYIGGRARMLGDADAELRDAGCDPVSVVEFAETYGLVPEAWLPYRDAVERVNARIPPKSLIGAATWGVGRYAVLEEQGDALVASICAHLAAKCPVPYAQEVDDAYEALQGSTVYRALTGDRRGSHAQRISGYRRTPDGVLFRVTGSWGADFADGGFAWVHEEWIRSPYCFDFYAMTFAPLITHPETP